jgi:hypothetical protein
LFALTRSQCTRGIKEKLQHISERPTATEEDERDTIAASDLAEDLRDAIVDYRVDTDTENRTLGSSLMPLTVLAADGNLQSRL